MNMDAESTKDDFSRLRANLWVYQG